MLGFFNVIKPTGVSSSYVVSQIKRKYKVKVGHLGTLDPMASGVLPVAINGATKFFDYFLKKDKTYIALMKFGVETNTLDSDGLVERRSPGKVSLESVQEAASKLVGTTNQIPPIYSAKSVNGERAYELARENKEVEIGSRKVQIYSINVEKWHKNDVFRLKIHCSAGTYVRSIVRDIAHSLNEVATCVAIIRTGSGPFKIEDAASLDEVLEGNYKGFIKLNDILKLPEVGISSREAKSLYSGQRITKDLPDGDYLLFFEGDEFSMASCKSGELVNKIYLYDKEKKW